MAALGKRTVGPAVALMIGAAMLIAGAAIAGKLLLRPAYPVEYPADPTDQPPSMAAFDVSTLPVPGCPVKAPDEAPPAPGTPGDEKLVEWGAVRLVRCTYFLAETIHYTLGTIDIIDDQAKVTDAVRVLRRMLTTAQFEDYFGPIDDSVRLVAAYPSYRYLFQFPDGHVTEVDDHYGYYRDGIVRHRWSVRGTSIEPLAVEGGRRCGVREPQPCQVSGAVASLP